MPTQVGCINWQTSRLLPLSWDTLKTNEIDILRSVHIQSSPSSYIFVPPVILLRASCQQPVCWRVLRNQTLSSRLTGRFYGCIKIEVPATPGWPGYQSMFSTKSRRLCIISHLRAFGISFASLIESTSHPSGECMNLESLQDHIMFSQCVITALYGAWKRQRSILEPQHCTLDKWQIFPKSNFIHWVCGIIIRYWVSQQ